MQKLELEGPKRANPDPTANPFRRRSKSLSSITNLNCDCIKKLKSVKKTTSFKRDSKKPLRDPVLKIVKFKGSHKKAREKLLVQTSKHADKDFKGLVNACERLSLDNSKLCSKISSFSESCHVISAKTELSGLASCSHQARMNPHPPCDVTIDELASYFETSVHIPKKMSSMAEMMYI